MVIERFLGRKRTPAGTVGEESINASRRAFLQGAGALAATTALGVDSLAARERREIFEEDGLYVSIGTFNKLPGNILVIASNLEQYKLSADAIKDRNHHRVERARFKIGGEKGQYTAFTGRIRDISDGRGDEMLERTIHVINANLGHNTGRMSDDELSALRTRVTSILAQQDNRPFSLIQFRGHQTHSHEYDNMFQMHDAVERIDSSLMKEAILYFGGCKGQELLAKYYTPETPVIAESETGQAAINSQLLVRLFDELGSGRNHSFHELFESIAATDPQRVGSGEVFFPGSSAYKSDVEFVRGEFPDWGSAWQG